MSLTNLTEKNNWRFFLKQRIMTVRIVLVKRFACHNLKMSQKDKISKNKPKKQET